MLHQAENLMKFGWLVPEIQAVEGLQNNRKQGIFFLLIDYSLKPVFASSNSFCQITLQYLCLDFQIWACQQHQHYFEPTYVPLLHF